MKTFTELGDTQKLTAPTGGVVANLPYLIGTLMVIATETVAQTLPFEGLICGVVIVPKNHHETWTEGEKIYWDVADNNFTSDADTVTNQLMGVAVPPIVDSVITLASNDTDMTVAGLAVTIVNYTGIAGKTITVTVNGVATVLTEGVEFVDTTGNNETATSLAAAMSLVAGVHAAAVGAVATAVAATGFTAAYPTLGSLRLDGATR